MTESTGDAREGVAFAVQSANVFVGAVVDGRVASSDTFEVSVVSPESQVVGSADTGSSDAASTGDLVVLPRVDGSAYTLREAGGTGTNLAAYDTSWACTRDGVEDPSLAAAGVDSIEVSPEAGEVIACTVTNTVAAVAPAIGGADSANDAVTSLTPKESTKYAKATVTWGLFVANNCA